MMILLIKMILAHLLGDFVFQTDSLCNRKNSKRRSERIGAIAWHSVTQSMLTYILIGVWSGWQIPLIIFTSHFIIDYAKIMSGKRGLPALLSDQFIHYIVIGVSSYYAYVIEPNAASDISRLSFSFWVIIASYVAVLTPSSIFIKSFIDYEGWQPPVSTHGMPNAGKWIGYLERLLILTFIFTKNVEGIGFLLAAKSVFRFGELNKGNDVKLTEYVLIGTFMSFAIAILLGFGAVWLISLNCE